MMRMERMRMETMRMMRTIVSTLFVQFVIMVVTYICMFILTLILHISIPVANSYHGLLCNSINHASLAL